MSHRKKSENITRADGSVSPKLVAYSTCALTSKHESESSALLTWKKKERCKLQRTWFIVSRGLTLTFLLWSLGRTIRPCLHTLPVLWLDIFPSAHPLEVNTSRHWLCNSIQNPSIFCPNMSPLTTVTETSLSLEIIKDFSKILINCSARMRISPRLFIQMFRQNDALMKKRSTPPTSKNVG